MFEGRKYRAGAGYNGSAIQFADVDGGVATTAYSYSMSDDEREAMARRIAAALNFTSNLPLELLEQLKPLPKVIP